MELWRAIIIAICNSLCEIWPISSFGHLEILKALLVDYSDGVKMIVRFSCFGILAAILVFYRKDLVRLAKESSRQKIIWLLLMSLPSAILFCLFEGKFPEIFYGLDIIGVTLLITAILALNIRLVTKLAHRKAKKKAELTNGTAFVTGLLGSLSILPGYSRIAIIMAMIRIYGQERKEATRLAVLANIPILCAMFGKCLCYGGVDFAMNNVKVVVFAILIAFTVGLLALVLLEKIEKKHDALRVFGWYQLVLALVVLVFGLVK